MTKRQMVIIARRAARLAVSEMGAADRQECRKRGVEPCLEYYREYLDQLQSNDYQCLQYWLAIEIEQGVREAAEIMKLLIRSRLQPAARVL